ncbi:ribonuclease HII [Pseudomarimonas arenosa]|uniref:Ribonuclease HII n=1 Tax=Pseudomarimonas arenosa TaxID=2774145 RepID=A0AAW3ZMC9_9GAMM|nr:ribonuclease HII [Pseudomarimonas arenosa]
MNSPAPYQARTPHAGIAGVDEAGRGPLAGPVVVAAVVLDPRRHPAGLADSKKLSEAQREKLYSEIIEQAIGFHIVHVDVAAIDRLNILQASLMGMREALRGLNMPLDLALIDGNKLPTDLPCRAEPLIAGDDLEPAISAASILAKVSRDRWMTAQHAEFPQYGFDRHKGYPTAAHLDALRRHGPCPLHRRSFAPVKQFDLFASNDCPPQR